MRADVCLIVAGFYLAARIGGNDDCAGLLICFAALNTPCAELWVKDVRGIQTLGKITRANYPSLHYRQSK